MKTIKSIIAVLFILTGVVGSAQTLMNIHKKDGTTLQIAIRDIDSVTYSAASTEKGMVNINLNHKWGMMNEQTFVLGSNLIHPMHFDTLNFSMLNYYVSNVKLKKTDGTYWEHPESYFLVKLEDLSTTTLKLNDVPVGDYTELSYTLGVDSARNNSGIQSGALDPANGMFWSWNSGYIMTKAEGNYYKDDTLRPFKFHLGGFKGINNIVTVKTVSFGTNNLTISPNKTSKINFQVNPGVMFHTTSVKERDTIHMPGASAKSMASDFFTHSYGFKFDSIEE